MIGNGIHCWKSDSLQIIGNKISGHQDGIYFEFVTILVIWRNISTHNIRYGLHFMFSNNDAYISNVFKQNGSGVAVMFTKCNHDQQSLHRKLGWRFLWAFAGRKYQTVISSAIVSTAIPRAFTWKEWVEAQIHENTFNDNGWGMKIQASCMDNVLSENKWIQRQYIWCEYQRRFGAQYFWTQLLG